MSKLTQFIESFDQDFSDASIAASISPQLDTEQNTGRYHPVTGKPLYSIAKKKVLTDNNWESSGLSGIDFCYVAHFECKLSGGDTVATPGTLEAHCRKDGSQYNVTIPESLWHVDAFAIVYLEYTKTADDYHGDFPFIPHGFKLNVYVNGLFDLESFANVVWLDAEFGDDANTGLDINHPVKTWDVAWPKVAVNGAVIIAPGSYITEYSYNSYTRSGFCLPAGASMIAAEPGSVFLSNSITHNTRRDKPLFANADQGTAEVHAYGCVFTHNHTGGTNYTNAVFKRASFHLHNCIMTENPANPTGRSLTYDATNTWTPKCTNTIFDSNGAWLNSHSGVDLDAVSSTFVYWPGDANVQKNDSRRLDIYDDTNYRSGEWSRLGVYAGTHAWPVPESVPQSEGWRLVAHGSIMQAPSEIANAEPNEYVEGWQAFTGDYTQIRYVFEANGVVHDIYTSDLASHINWWKGRTATDVTDNTWAVWQTGSLHTGPALFQRQWNSIYWGPYSHNYLLGHTGGYANGLIIWGTAYNIMFDVTRDRTDNLLGFYMKVYVK